MRIVDLSQPVQTGMQVFPGDPQVSTSNAATVTADGFQVAELHLGTHSGTHVDAPLHTVDGGAPVDALELSTLLAPARIVDLAGARANQLISWEDVSAQLADLAAGTIVLFHTGWSRHFNSPQYLRHPVLDPDIARHLVAAGVQVIGVDTLNPDPTPGEDSTGQDSTAQDSPNGDPSGPVRLPVHEVILGAGGVIVENLTNLASVTWNAPLFSALPLRLAGLDGSPVRAVALQV